MTSGQQPSRVYGFVRARQLEGTYPGDPATGIWITTLMRLRRGWGSVAEEDWPYPKKGDPWPPLEPPGLDEKAKRDRLLRYQRVRDSFECRYALAYRGPVLASFEITEQWFDANKGIITKPQESDPIVGSHAVSLTGYSDKEGVFKFHNSWGQTWGDEGFGTLPYEFFDHWLLDAYLADWSGMKLPTSAPNPIAFMEWGVPDFLGNIFHVKELYDTNADERLAWAFAVSRCGFLDVEELYVRPHYRRQGHGAHLLQALCLMALKLHLPIRIFIPYADCGAENVLAATRLLAKEGFFLTNSGERWAPYAAVKKPEYVHIPQPPGLVRPSAGGLMVPLPAFEPTTNGDGATPIDESQGPLSQPDWQTKSDKAFLEAAQATLSRHGEVLRRLA